MQHVFDKTFKCVSWENAGASFNLEPSRPDCLVGRLGSNKCFQGKGGAFSVVNLVSTK